MSITKKGSHALARANATKAMHGQPMNAFIQSGGSPIQSPFARQKRANSGEASVSSWDELRGPMQVPSGSTAPGAMCVEQQTTQSAPTTTGCMRRELLSAQTAHTDAVESMHVRSPIVTRSAANATWYSACPLMLTSAPMDAPSRRK